MKIEEERDALKKKLNEHKEYLEDLKKHYEDQCFTAMTKEYREECLAKSLLVDHLIIKLES